jgi:hypothetical protein
MLKIAFVVGLVLNTVLTVLVCLKFRVTDPGWCMITFIFSMVPSFLMVLIGGIGTQVLLYRLQYFITHVKWPVREYEIQEVQEMCPRCKYAGYEMRFISLDGHIDALGRRFDQTIRIYDCCNPWCKHRWYIRSMPHYLVLPSVQR